MPRVTITIPDDIYDAVRDRAKANYRTINNQLRYELKQLIDTSTPISTQTPHRKTRIDAPVSQPQSQPQSQPPQTPQSEPQTQLTESERRSRQKSFTDLSKEILGHPLMETDYSLTPDNLYYPYAEEVEGKFLRYADTMPYEKQVEYLEEYKHYDK